MVARFGEVWTGTAVRRNREGMTAAAGMSFADDARMWPAEPDRKPVAGDYCGDQS